MSMPKKEDPRTRRSKEMFKEAIFTLLGEGVLISELTVQKIATTSGLNRTTFYLHFQDIQDLLSQINEEILNELSDKINVLIDAKDLSQRQQLTQLLDYLYKQRTYLFVLFNVSQFEEQLYMFLREIIETRRRNTEKELPDNYVSIDIMTASLVGIIMWWIKKGMHFSSDYIAEQIHLMYRVDKGGIE